MKKRVRNYPKTRPKKVEKTVVSGVWHVSFYSDNGVDETQLFAGFNFNFDENGTVLAYNSSVTVNGTWSVSRGGSGDDSNHTHFHLSFPSIYHMEELTDDWHVISLSGDKIDLEDVSGGNGGIDRLTFSK